MAETWRPGYSAAFGGQPTVVTGDKDDPITVAWCADEGFQREIIAAHNTDAALVEALRDIERILNRRKATYAQYAHGIAVAALATLTPGEPAHE